MGRNYVLVRNMNTRQGRRKERKACKSRTAEDDWNRKLKQTVKERECKMKRNDNKKVDGLCQHRLVQEFRSSFLVVSPSLYYHVFLEWQTLRSAASTKAVRLSPQHHTAAAHSWPPLAYTVSPPVSPSLSLSHPCTPGHTHENTHPAPSQINLSSCLHNCTFSDCSATLCDCVCVCLRACASRSYKSLTLQKMIFFA